MNELYEIALSYNNPKTKDGLPTVLFGALKRAGYATGKTTLDRERIRGAVLDGSLWIVRGIGDANMRRVCEWLDNEGATDAE